jgi:hypothetical protein
MLAKRLVTVCIIAVCLGFWEVYAKGVYIANWARDYGLAEASIGYFAVLGTGYLISYLITRKMGR